MGQCRVAVFRAIRQIVTARIFVSVQMLFERTIIRGDQVFINMLKPLYRIILPKCPAHDVEALFQNALTMN